MNEVRRIFQIYKFARASAYSSGLDFVGVCCYLSRGGYDGSFHAIRTL